MYNSQTGQDRFLDIEVFKGFKGGVFIDVGAHDGVTINNTIFFENQRGWTGINVEPIKSVYDNLVINRPKCINVNCAISEINGTADFIINSGYTEMLSGLKDTYDPRHLERLNNEIEHYGGNTITIPVTTIRLDAILHEYKFTHVNYLSIDVEGAEFSVIKSIDFTKVFIDVIGFENNFDDTSPEIVNYL